MPIQLSKLELSHRRTKVWLNGLIVGNISYSQTLKTYWLRMQNISDELSEHDTIEQCLDEAKSNVFEWLNELIEDLS